MPFDWIYATAEIILTIIEKDFSDFLDTSYLQSQHPRRQCGHSIYKRGNFFNHHDPSREPDRSAFKRRVSRFRKALENPKKVILLNFNGSIKDLNALGIYTRTKILSFKLHTCTTSSIPKVSYQAENLIQISLFCGTMTKFAQKRKMYERKDLSLIDDGRTIRCHLSRMSAIFLLSSVIK